MSFSVNLRTKTNGKPSVRTSQPWDSKTAIWLQTPRIPTAFKRAQYGGRKCLELPHRRGNTCHHIGGSFCIAEASAESNFRIVLRWNDNSSNEDAFLLERSVDKEDWSQLARLESDVTEYIDASPLDTTEYYRISAINASDTSGIRDCRRDLTVSTPYGLSDEATFDAAVVEWNHNSNYREAKRTGRVTGNRPTVSFDDIVILQHLMNELNEAESELAEFNAAISTRDASMTQRLAHLEPLIGEACIGSTMRILNAILSWLAIALLWGFVAAFGASYAGKQLMVLKGIGQAEGFFFIDRVNEAREANNNQPLMGLLLLPAFCSCSQDLPRLTSASRISTASIWSWS